MMNLTLRQLRLFESIARLGTLTRAANEQAISQSAASQALKELEGGLGYGLFHRVGRELVLSEAAQAVLPRVQQLLALADGLGDPSGAAMGGPLRLAASVTIASYLLPWLLARFLDRHPAVEPAVRISNTAGVMRELEQGWAHLGLIEGPAQHRQLQLTPWRTDRLVVFCRPDHPLVGQGPVSLGTLAQANWVVREEGSGTRWVLDDAAAKLGLPLKVALALNRQEAIKQSVKAGLGIGCLSELSVAQEVARGELCQLATPLPLTRTFSLVSWPDERQPPLVRALLAFLQAEG